MATSKQDMTYARTASDIERKYNFGKSFGEVYGLIDEAKKIAKEAEEAVSNLDTELDQEEIFNRLTNDGKVQGIYRDENGDIYINGQYVKFDGATIGGWEITGNALYKDVTASDGTVYRVWFQPPGGDNPSRTWILSCQQKIDGAFYGKFVLYADGSAKFGDTVINGNGSITFGDWLSIDANGSMYWKNPDGGSFPAYIDRYQGNDKALLWIDSISANEIRIIGDPTESGHATHKAYVDSLIANLQAQIDALKS